MEEVDYLHKVLKVFRYARHDEKSSFFLVLLITILYYKNNLSIIKHVDSGKYLQSFSSASIIKLIFISYAMI